jgi:phosphate:Na+ symporter
MIDIDIDSVYERSIKVLYGSIVGFISEATSKITSEHAEDLFALRTAGRHIVEAVKDVKHMRKNLEIYRFSENKHVRQEYDLLRIQLGNILRELGKLREDSADPENLTLLDLDRLRVNAENSDIVANGKLDQLIRDGLITEQMATSLMNDNAYTYEISMKLIEMGGILFAARAMDLKGADKSLVLDDDDIDDIVEKADTERVFSAVTTAEVKQFNFG